MFEVLTTRVPLFDTHVAFYIPTFDILAISKHFQKRRRQALIVLNIIDTTCYCNSIW